MAGTLVRALIRSKLSSTRLSLSYRRSYFLALLVPGRLCKVPLTSETIVLMFSNSSAEMGSYSSLAGHFWMMMKLSVQLKFCQMASVTNGANGWRAMRRVSRVFFKSGTFL